MTSDLVVGEQPDPLHLVKHRVVAAVDLVPALHVPYHQEGIQPRPSQLPLVGRGVGA